MISAGDFRNGVTFELDGNVVQVIEFQHVSRVRVLHSFVPSIRMSSLVQW